MKLMQRLKRHVKENKWQYLLIVIAFLAGIVMGDFKAGGLTNGVRDHLLGLIDDYLQGGTGAGVAKQVILWNSFLNQAKSIIAIWFLGLTIIGMPLILVVIFLKGFSLGFTVCFLVSERAVSGILISILSILPQNLIYIPLLIIWSVVGINFSIYITRSHYGGGVPLSRGFAGYTLMMLISLVIVLVGALIEAYLSPLFLGLFV
ncbi:MAG: stage II sporulation protein M [Syntrophomonadaceae bacterium]